MLLQIPPEVRLLIIQAALVDDTPIPLSIIFITKSALLSTCRRLREEGTPIFYAQNDFAVTAQDFKSIDRLRPLLGPKSCLVRNLTIDYNLGAITYVDQLWNLSKVSQAIQPTCLQALDQFPNLQSLSIQITTPHSCLQHTTQLEEVLCASFRAGCVNLSGNVYSQLTQFGEVCASTFKDDGTKISTTLMTLHPKAAASSRLVFPTHTELGNF